MRIKPKIKAGIYVPAYIFLNQPINCIYIFTFKNDIDYSCLIKEQTFIKHHFVSYGIAFDAPIGYELSLGFQVYYHLLYRLNGVLLIRSDN